jgi:hypothetical protein
MIAGSDGPTVQLRSRSRGRLSQESGPFDFVAWGEIKAAAMKVDSRREVRGVSEPARFALDAHDLAIESRGHAAGDRMFGETEHAVEVSLERGRDGFDRIEPRAHGSAVPASKASLYRRGLAVGSEGAQATPRFRPGQPHLHHAMRGTLPRGISACRWGSNWQVSQ